MEAKVEKVNQLNRMSELYLELNRQAASVQMTINYGNSSDMRGVFPNFRYCMIELYYLVRFNDTVKGDSSFSSIMEKWIEADLSKGIQLDFGKYSLKLFNRFMEKLVQIGAVEI
ncbi:MAG: hypothetical protein M0R51_12495 [Clostridia bacterium]|jgi:hypothetical protein|nr:hypothetical protein [Clostridia bacterium]